RPARRGARRRSCGAGRSDRSRARAGGEELCLWRAVAPGGALLGERFLQGLVRGVRRGDEGETRKLGVVSANDAAPRDWLEEHRITEVELLVPDMAAIARGKILPTNKFLAGLENDTLRLPESIFGQMVTGADAETDTLSQQAPDMILVPDAETICIVP